MQLIKITTVPISIELKTSNARLKNTAGVQSLGVPKLTMTQNQGAFRISSDPIKINIDTYETMKSAGIVSPMDSNLDAKQKAINIAFQATARYVDEGNALADTPPSQNPIAELAKNYYNRDIETMLSFIPSQKPNISWQDGTLNIQYDVGELDIDWDDARPSFEFVPPTIELTVLERPTVVIEYIGGPIYVPPSADPNYQSPAFDTQA
ncbi:MAG: DUF6470 family protein [Acetanaerobacterium sp.]